MTPPPCPCVLMVPLYPGFCYAEIGLDGIPHELTYQQYVYALDERFRPMIDVATCPVHHPRKP